MTGLIDGDIVCYRAAASAENEPVEISILRTDLMMMDILQLEENHITFLTGSQTAYPITDKVNFRKLINPEYKANRKQPKPKHLDACRKYLIDEYKAIVTEGYEADDAMGFNQTEESVIYTIDKDLLMIPGHHFNFVKKEYYEVSELDGLKMFYKQMLIGDSSDNVFGVDKIGKVKAAKLIDHLETEKEMKDVVVSLYSDPERYLMNADCLWIWRKEGERYSNRKMD
ncbi:exodeoxyribonuclease [Caudoviricetes sp.]|nr:exodeoxyribonuclease [Caudoviricetes sp.]